MLAGEGSNPSWGWKSILASRGILVQGLRCQIGTGHQVLAFHDNWIPEFPPRPPNCIPTDLPWSTFTSVAAFIDNGVWDGLFLNQVFSAIDVSIISSIPLPVEPIPDQFVWQLSDSGAYSVHSGYNVVHFGLIKVPVVGPTSPMDPEAWDRVWTFPVPPKLRFFIWKCILGILPTRSALSSRIRDFPRQCPVCAVSDETVSHLLLFCPLATRFGALMNIPLQAINSTNFCIVWRKVLRLPPHVGKRIVFFWWRVWKSRNTVVFHNKQTLLPGLQAQMVLHMAKSELDLDEEDALWRPAPAQAAAPPCRWRPPPVGRLKINVDGAIRPGQGGAIGLVLRDEAGTVLFAGGRSFPQVTDVFTVEALAVREALRWGIGRGTTLLDVEGDAAMVTRHILDKKCLHSRAGVIVQECRLLLSRFPSIRCFSVKREANTMAHQLGRHALTMLPLRTRLLDFTQFACSNF
ncbi:hypothetical protein LINPERHAP2_LOCUS22902 [Linum perenne]